MSVDGTLHFDTSLNSDGIQKGANKLGGIVKGLGIFEIIKKGLQMVGQSIDAAVSRYDTLNKFPKVMEQMGYGADVAESSIKKLSNGIQGLPTTLDGIVKNTRQLAIATGSLESGVDTALSLNNAFLASGSAAGDAERGLIQYTQMLSSGKVDMQSWRTLNETMTYALQKTAESFGFAGASAKNDLYAALRDGDITFEQFNARIVELDKGVGGFAELAKSSTGGIGTAWTNMQTAIVRGTTNIVASIDTGLSATRFNSIENIIINFGKGFNSTLNGVAKVIPPVIENLDVLAAGAVGVGVAFAAKKGYDTWTSAAKNASSVADILKNTNQQLAISISKNTDSKLALAASSAKQAAAEAAETAVTAKAKAEKLQLVAAEKASEAAKALEIAQTTKGAFAQTAQNEASRAAFIAKNAEVVATEATTAAEVAETSAKRLSIVAQNEQNISVGLGTALVGYFTGAWGLETIATATATVATNLFSIALKAIPLIGIIALIGALVAGIIALISWLAKGSKEYQQQKKEVEALAEAQKQLASSMEQSKQAHEEDIAALDAQAQASSNLVASLRSLVDVNGKVASSHKDVQKVIDDLNKSYEGLNLTYDEEAGYLSASVEEVEKYIAAKNSQSKLNVLDKRRLELAAEQARVEANLAEIAAKRDIIDQNTNISVDERRRLIGQLDKTTKEYETTQDELALDIQANNAAIEASTDNMADNAVNAYEAINGALTEDGKNLRQLAKEYDVSTDEILADMDEQGLTMQEWATKKAATMTEEGLSIEQLATKWGMTTEEVKQYMTDWGMSLDEFSKEMDATHTSAGLSLEDLAHKWGTSTEEIKHQMALQNLSLQEWSDTQDAKTQEVINSFEEIPPKYDKTANDLINILQKNAERYSKWTENIATLSQTMSADAIAELQKLGPEANSAIEEMIADPSKAAAFEESIQAVMSAGASGAEVGAADPRFPEAGTEVNTAITEGVAGDTSEAEAAGGQVIEAVHTGVANAVIEKDFSAVGQQVMQDILAGVNESDTSGIAEKMASGFEAGTKRIETTSAAMKTTVVSTLSGMGTEANASIMQGTEQMASTYQSASTRITNILNLMRNQVGTTMRSMSQESINTNRSMWDGMASTAQAGSTRVNSILTGMKNTVLVTLRSMANESKTAVSGMMDGIAASITSGATKVTTSITTMKNSVLSILKELSTESQNTTKSMMDSMQTEIDAGGGRLGKSAEGATQKTISGFDGLRGGAETAMDNAMAGMLRSMNNHEGSLYAKADGIAKEIARRIDKGFDNRSPSHVMQEIFGFVMMGMLKPMVDKAGLLYDQADAITEGIRERLTFPSDELSANLVQRMRYSLDAGQTIASNQFATVPAYGVQGSSTVVYESNMEVKVTSPKPMDEYKLTRELEDFQSRTKWRIP